MLQLHGYHHYRRFSSNEVCKESSKGILQSITCMPPPPVPPKKNITWYQEPIWGEITSVLGSFQNMKFYSKEGSTLFLTMRFRFLTEKFSRNQAFYIFVAPNLIRRSLCNTKVFASKTSPGHCLQSFTLKWNRCPYCTYKKASCF